MESHSLTLDEACAFLNSFHVRFPRSIPSIGVKLMQHNLQPDSLVDLKFIMADTGFGKTFIYDRIKDGTLPKSTLIHGRARWLYSDHYEFKKRLLNCHNG